MTGTTRPLPDRYPDVEEVGRFRCKDIEFDTLPVRMTIAPGEETVALWELEDGHPIQWMGTGFRVDAEPPGLYLNYKYERRMSWAQRDALARLAAKFWMS